MVGGITDPGLIAHLTAMTATAAPTGKRVTGVSWEGQTTDRTALIGYTGRYDESFSTAVAVVVTAVVVLLVLRG